MKNIDLHIHSTNSDGTYDTKQLLESLSNKSVDLFSFTDHESIQCYTDLKDLDYVYKPMSLLNGVELSFAYHGQVRDILGYGINLKVLSEFLDYRYSKEKRLSKQNIILEQFKKQCESLGLTFDNNIECKTGNTAEAFHLMCNSLNRYVNNINKFPFISNNTKFYWEYVSNKETPFFVDESIELSSMEEVIDIIHAADGLAFLAHPCAYGIPREHVLDLIKFAISSDIDGIEIYHASNKNDDVKYLTAIAQEYKVFISGGSDFHGDTKPNLELVSGYNNIDIDYEIIRPWVENLPLSSLK